MTAGLPTAGVVDLVGLLARLPLHVRLQVSARAMVHGLDWKSNASTGLQDTRRTTTHTCTHARTHVRLPPGCNVMARLLPALAWGQVLKVGPPTDAREGGASPLPGAAAWLDASPERTAGPPCQGWQLAGLEERLHGHLAQLLELTVRGVYVRAAGQWGYCLAQHGGRDACQTSLWLPSEPARARVPASLLQVFEAVGATWQQANGMLAALCSRPPVPVGMRGSGAAYTNQAHRPCMCKG